MIGWIRGSLLWLLGLSAGCGTLPATMDLVAVAREGVAGAQQAEVEHYAAQQRWLADRQLQLARAFDSDVRQVATGAIMRADGSAVAFDAQWVIDARRGYDVAVSMLHSQSLADMQAHHARLDNLAATDEALAGAHDLLSARWMLLQALRPQSWLAGGITNAD
jgi:hypothetical protein